MEKSREKNYKIFGRAMAIIFVIVTFLAFVSTIGVKNPGGISLDDSITVDILHVTGETTHYEGRSFLPPKKGETVLINVKLPDDLNGNNVLCFSNYNSIVTVEYDGIEIYSHGSDKAKDGFLTGHTLIRAVLPDDAKGSVTIHTYQLEDNTTSQITGTMLMPPETAWLYPISNPWKQVQFLLFAVFIIIAFLTLVFYTVTMFRGIDSRQGVAVSLFCISLSFWAMGFTNTIFVISDNDIAIPFIEYVALYLMPAFFSTYMAFGKKDGSRAKKLFLGFTTFFLALFLIASIWQAFLPGHSGFTSLLTTCHVGIFIGAAVSIVSIFRDKSENSLLMKYGMIITLAMSLIEVIRVFMVRTGFSSEHGLLAFTSQTLTAYIVLVFEVTIMTDYAYRVYASYKKRLETERLEAIAYTDGLTGLGNRNAFDSLERKRLRESPAYTLAFIDADGLKAANDLFGHETGDELLRIVGRAISSSSERYKCRCYRYGGDEFIVDSENSTDVGNAVSMMKNVLKANDNSEMPFEITASVGIVVHETGSTDTIDDVIKKADEKMYEAKIENKRTRENVLAEIQRRMNSAANSTI